MLGRINAWLGLFIVITMTLVVILRYGFNLGWIALQESVTYMHASYFMLGMAYTLQHQGHVRVDIFYRQWSAKTQARVDFFGTLFLLIPLCICLIIFSWQYVVDAWNILEGSREAGGLPLVFLLKTLLLVMPILLLLQGLTELVSKAKEIR